MDNNIAAFLLIICLLNIGIETFVIIKNLREKKREEDGNSK